MQRLSVGYRLAGQNLSSHRRTGIENGASGIERLSSPSQQFQILVRYVARIAHIPMSIHESKLDTLAIAQVAGTELARRLEGLELNSSGPGCTWGRRQPKGEAGPINRH
jgi:hypothetical protein